MKNKETLALDVVVAKFGSSSVFNGTLALTENICITVQCRVLSIVIINVCYVLLSNASVKVFSFFHFKNK